MIGQLEITFIIWLVLTVFLVTHKKFFATMPLSISYIALSLFMFQTFDEFKGFYFLIICFCVFGTVFTKIIGR